MGNELAQKRKEEVGDLRWLMSRVAGYPRLLAASIGLIALGGDCTGGGSAPTAIPD
jgi:hypothetical protein